jgi:uncharacterized protein (DUF58 family)
MAATPASPRGTGEAVALRAEALGAPLPPLMVAADRVAMTVAQGVHGRRRVGQGETFWQFRRYQTGDTAQRIDWRQSAKAEPLFVRETEWEAAESVWLWRDASASMDWRSAQATSTKLERANLVTLAIAALLVRGGERVAELGRGRPARGGRAAYTRFAAGLLGLEGEPVTTSLPPVERIPRHAQLVLVGDFLSPLGDLDRVLKGYVAEGVRGHLLQILDPAEIDLPFSGRTRFLGLEGEGDFLAGRAESLRPAYAERLARRQDALSTLARLAGWTFAVHRTDRPPETALMALYGALSGAPV